MHAALSNPEDLVGLYGAHFCLICPKVLNGPAKALTHGIGLLPYRVGTKELYVKSVGKSQAALSNHWQYTYWGHKFVLVPRFVLSTILR